MQQCGKHSLVLMQKHWLDAQHLSWFGRADWAQLVVYTSVSPLNISGTALMMLSLQDWQVLDRKTAMIRVPVAQWKGTKQYKSGSFNLGGFQWSMVFMVHSDKPQHMAAFLQLDPYIRPMVAEFELILDHPDPLANKRVSRKEARHEFTKEDCGFSDFLEQTQLDEFSQLDGCLHFKLLVNILEVKPPQTGGLLGTVGLSNGMSDNMMGADSDDDIGGDEPQPKCAAVLLPVDKWRATKRHKSPALTLGRTQWSVLFTENGNNLGTYVKLESYSGRTVWAKFQVVLEHPSGQRSQHVCREEARHEFKDEDRGFADFIEQARLPGYVFRDGCLHFQLHVRVLKGASTNVVQGGNDSTRKLQAELAQAKMKIQTLEQARAAAEERLTHHELARRKEFFQTQQAVERERRAEVVAKQRIAQAQSIVESKEQELQQLRQRLLSIEQNRQQLQTQLARASEQLANRPPTHDPQRASPHVNELLNGSLLRSQKISVDQLRELQRKLNRLANTEIPKEIARREALGINQYFTRVTVFM
eukprot:g6762.t1